MQRIDSRFAYFLSSSFPNTIKKSLERDDFRIVILLYLLVSV